MEIPFVFFALEKAWQKQKDCNGEPGPGGWKSGCEGHAQIKEV